MKSDAFCELMPMFLLIYTRLIKNCLSFSVLKTSFKAYDNNNDGLVLITDKLRAKIQEEAEKLGLKKPKDDVVDSFLTRADTNNDKKLSLKGMIHLQINFWFQFLKTGTCRFKALNKFV